MYFVTCKYSHSDWIVYLTCVHVIHALHGKVVSMVNNSLSEKSVVKNFGYHSHLVTSGDVSIQFFIVSILISKRFGQSHFHIVRHTAVHFNIFPNNSESHIIFTAKKNGGKAYLVVLYVTSSKHRELPYLLN